MFDFFHGILGKKFHFTDDNAITYRTQAVQNFLDVKDINRKAWPAYSPDLNFIEN